MTSSPFGNFIVARVRVLLLLGSGKVALGADEHWLLRALHARPANVLSGLDTGGEAIFSAGSARRTAITVRGGVVVGAVIAGVVL